MPGSKTAYLSKKVLDHCLGGAPYTPPANIWFVVSSAAFDPNATGAACTELALAGGYARLAAANDATTWAAASAAAPSLKSNNLDLVWTTATAAWALDPASVYVADAAVAGNLLYGADLTGATAVALGDTFKILAGTFVFSED